MKIWYKSGMWTKKSCIKLYTNLFFAMNFLLQFIIQYLLCNIYIIVSSLAGSPISNQSMNTIPMTWDRMKRLVSMMDLSLHCSGACGSQLWKLEILFFVQVGNIHRNPKILYRHSAKIKKITTCAENHFEFSFRKRIILEGFKLQLYPALFESIESVIRVKMILIKMTNIQKLYHLAN